MGRDPWRSLRRSSKKFRRRTKRGAWSVLEAGEVITCVSAAKRTSKRRTKN